MNKKFLSIIAKVIVILAILMLCTYSSVSAFSFGFKRIDYSSIREKLEEYYNNKNEVKPETKPDKEETEEYDLTALKKDLEVMRSSGDYDINDISGAIDKLPQSEERTILNAIKEMFVKLQERLEKIDLKSLLDKLLDAITSLMGGGSSSSLPVEATSINMTSVTAGEFAGEDYEVELHANIYKHVDENGNEDSDKWALLIHPFMLSGDMIASKVGPYYYEKGYNIIAPDLRSFGDSEGEVALGFLESLDIYDWLELLNEDYAPSQVIVHGISLGGATTNFLSGIDEFIANGPTKIDKDLKSLRELNVVGLVEDCGYTNMTEFAGESFLLNLNIGLTEENFDYYSDATNSLKYCDIPMLVIHGSNDTTVDPENAETVANTVNGYVETWIIDGGPHAGIIIGMNGEAYKEHVQSFIDKVNNGDLTMPDEPEVEEPVEEETSRGGLIERILNFLNSWRNR